MDLSSAINVIESVAGFTDTETAVGEAWAVVMAQLEAAPVPVAERLPEPQDCDAEGRCWWFCLECPGEHSYWILAKEVYCEPTYWLPANALPLPSGEVEA